MLLTTRKKLFIRIVILLWFALCPVFTSNLLAQNPVISSVSVNSCVGSITISVTSGTAPYTYEWKDSGGNVLAYTSFVASGLTAGNYTVEVTDNNGNSTGPATYTVTSPPDLVGSVVVNDVSCRGDSDAQVVITMANGNPGYDWELFNGGGNSIGTGSVAFPNNVITLSGLGVGNYTLTAQDQDGCTGDINFTITEPADFLSVNIASSTDATCFDSADGTITANPSGGWGDYRYQWLRTSDGVVVGNTQTVTGLAPGTYRLNLSDRAGTGCTVTTGVVTINSPPQITSAVSITDITCNGAGDGTIDVNISGGVAPYSYSWDNGSTNEDISSLGPGNYTLTVTDAAGCNANFNYTISEPAVLNATVNATNVICFGESTGAISSNVTGGTAPYTYNWSTGSTSNGINALSAGAYTLTVTDANGCDTTVNAIAISQPVSALAFDSSVETLPSCFGGNDGSLMVTFSGGNGPYTYIWSDGQTGSTATNLTSGSYSVTATDANGCTLTQNLTLNDPIRIDVTPVLNIPSCNAGADGSITVSAINGTGPYTYNWNTGDSGATINGLVAGNYSVAVTDALGCSVIENYVLGEPAVLDANATVNNISCSGLTDGSIFLTPSGGTAPYNYSWSNGATTNNVSGLGAGNYSVTITDANGCPINENYTVIDPDPIMLTSSTVDVLCKGAATGSIDLTVTGGTAPYTYLWSNGATSEDVATLTAGTYTVTVEDAGSCSVNLNVTITEPATVLTLSGTTTDVTCNGSDNGTIDLTVIGGDMPYSYSWSNGSTIEDISSLAPGNYTVSVTDANGCIKSASFSISEPAPLSVNTSQNNVSCNGLNDGSITTTPAGGTAPYTYSWSDDASITTQNRSSLSPRTYTLTTTDANGCQEVNSFTITEPSTLNATAALQHISCFGEHTGSINLSPSGGVAPYTFSWSNGALTEDLSGLNAGNYAVTITDANGCTYSTDFDLIEPSAALAISSNVSQISCNGQVDGAINLDISGGTAPYNFNWSNGATTEDLANLSASTYTVTVADALGCTASANFEITNPPVLSVTNTVSNVSCFNAGDGEISLNPSGGEGPYTFLWSTGETTNQVSGLSPGNYSVVVTDVRGCIVNDSFTITQPTSLSLSYTSNDVNCFAGSDGSIDITVNGGTAPHTYNWSNGETTQDINGLLAQNYQVTVTDVNGCSISETIAINEPSAVLSLSATVNDISCFGGSDGNIQVFASGGTAPYSFSWNTGSSTSNIAGLGVGTYQVTVTDANGCQYAESYSIQMPDALIASGTVTNINCNGELNGAIDLAISGGTLPYTFNWSNGATTEDLSSIAAGNYSVSITDNSGCALTRNFTVTQPLPITVNETVSDVLCFGDGDGSIDLTVSGGTAPYTYSWSNGETTQDIFNLSGGTYEVTITDGNACQTTLSYLVNEPTAALAITGSITDELCNGDNQGALDVTVTGGTAPYSYQWNTGQSAEDIAGLNQGVYQLTVTDANGCSISESFSVSGPDVLVVSAATSNISCQGGNDGAIDLTISGGIGPYTYLWNTGETTEDLSSLTASNYSVTITDSNGCSAKANYSLTQPTAISVIESISDIACFGDGDGSIDLTVSGGVAPYSYSWSNGEMTQDIFNLSGGTYEVTITDGNACQTTLSYVVNEPSAALAIMGSITDELCNGDNQGAIDVTVTGGTAPYAYQWNTGQSAEDIAGLNQGVYQLTVTDANGCTISESFSVDGPDVLYVSAATSNISCQGGNDGALDLTISGGTGPYTYLWNTGETTEDLSSLTASNYSVTITDSNGCSATANYTLTQPAAISVIESISDIACFGDGDGSIDLTVSGGTAPYTYSWSNGETTQDIFNLNGGTYEVTITDGNACQTTISYVVNEPTAALTIAGSITDELCNGDNQGALDITVSGGTAPYSYQWNTGQSAEDIGGLNQGVYQLTVTDANGCTISESFSVDGPDVLSVAASLSDVTCNGNNDGAIDLSVTGGTAPFSYNWSNGQTIEDLSGLAPGSYSVSILDANGCQTTGTYNIVQPLVLTANASVSGVTCFGTDDGKIDLSVSGGNAPYSYSWSNGEVKKDLSGLTGGSYTVIVTDSKGCQIQETFTVQSPASELAIASTITDASCFGRASGAIALNVTGGTSPYSFNWSNGSNQRDLVNLFSGTYSITVTDANGCSINEVFTINQPDELAVTFDIVNSTCLGDADGSVRTSVTGGQAPYTYAWSNGSTAKDIINVNGGTYNLTITDANGCTHVTAVEVGDSRNLAVQIQKSDVLCKGEASGSINLSVSGGSGNYNYAWANGDIGPGRSALVAGVYEVVVSDNLGCATTSTIVIGEPAEVLSVDLSGNTELACFGDNSGRLIATPNGGIAPYTYLWSNGARTASIENLVADNYTVTITDANGCLVQSSLSITEPIAPLQINVSGNLNLACKGEANGSLAVQVTGGSGMYEYLWSTGDRTDLIDNLAVGDYTLRVIDEAGCVQEQVFSIVEPDELSLARFRVNESQCFDDRNGSIELDIEGGTGPYAYQWSTGATSKNLIGISSGNYTVNITDANGCNIQSNFSLAEPERFVLEPEIQPISCTGANDASISLNIEGGIDPISIRWSNGASTETISGVAPGEYNVLVTDKNGCTLQSTFNVVEPLDLTLDAYIEEAARCNDPASGRINLIVSGGTEPYRYRWSNGDTISNLVDILPGTYVVEVIDQNICSTQGTYTVLQPEPLQIGLSTEPFIDCENRIAGTIIKADVRGGVGNYNYQWSKGSSVNNELFITEPGRVSIEVSDLRGCFQMNSISVDIPELGLADFIYNAESIDRTGDLASNDPVSFFDQSLGEVIDWHWDFGDGFDSDEIDPIHTYDAPGQYTVTLTVTDRTGCETQMISLLDITEGYRIMFPDAFTPNGDGNNDFYRPQMLGLTKFQLIIYNTWGEVIFSTEDIETKGWDGTVNGLPAENGNYVFKLIGLSFNGLPVERDGIFALIK